MPQQRGSGFLRSLKKLMGVKKKGSKTPTMTRSLSPYRDDLDEERREPTGSDAAMRFANYGSFRKHGGIRRKSSKKSKRKTSRKSRIKRRR